MIRGGSAPRILITGVSGFVGSHLADQFAKSGYEVIGLVRKTSNLRFVERLDIELRVADLTDSSGMSEIVSDVDYVVHPAGLIAAESRDEFMKANRDGTARLLESAVKHCPNCRRFVYISSQAAAGPSESIEPIDETVQPHPVSDYGASKLAGEEECHKVEGQIPITILRPPAVYGPRDNGILPFFKLVASGWFWKLGRIEPYASIVFVRDLAVAAVMAIESQNAVGQTYFIANRQTPSVWELQNLIAEVMKVDVKPLYTPLWMARLIVPIARFGAALVNTSPGLSRDKLKELSQRYWVCDSKKAEDDFGWRAETPLEVGLGETIEWYKKSRWV